MRVGKRPDVSRGMIDLLIESGDEWPISGDGITTRDLPGMPGGLIALVDWQALGDPEVATDLATLRDGRDRCRHCGRGIVRTGYDLPGWTHELGKGAYLAQCKPEEADQPFGQIAEPKEDDDH